MKENISKIHYETLAENGRETLGSLNRFKGVLGGGTALALQLGHRKSYDFDMFLEEPVPSSLLAGCKKNLSGDQFKVVVNTTDELSVVVDGKKISFIYFPFKPLHDLSSVDSLPMFSLEDLATNKAYAIGRRATWRDYVDIFFILNNRVSLGHIVTEANKRFGGAFSGKLFLEQLVYFEDLTDFAIEFVAREYTEKEIKDFLKEQVEEYLKKKLS